MILSHAYYTFVQRVGHDVAGLVLYQVMVSARNPATSTSRSEAVTTRRPVVAEVEPVGI